MRKEIKGVNFRVFSQPSLERNYLHAARHQQLKKIRNETIKLHLVVQNEMGNFCMGDEGGYGIADYLPRVPFLPKGPVGPAGKKGTRGR